jgi:hypothetical protein
MTSNERKVAASARAERTAGLSATSQSFQSAFPALRNQVSKIATYGRKSSKSRIGRTCSQTLRETSDDLLVKRGNSIAVRVVARIIRNVHQMFHGEAGLQSKIISRKRSFESTRPKDAVMY